MKISTHNDRKRVLVTTVDPWSTKVGADTMSSLMSQYGAENVASINIRATRSDSKSASRYFHILEGRVMKSIFNKKITTGEEYNIRDANVITKDDTEETARYSFFKKHRWAVFLFARELVWLLGKWKTQELNEFLDDFNPEVLICPIEGYIHFNALNLYIIKRCHPKVIGFLWDDNFTYKQSRNCLYKVHRFWLRHGVKQMVKECETIFCLSPKMKEECDKEFGIQSQLLTKPIFNQGDFKSYKVGNPIRMLYTGNLFVGRDKTIIAIAEALRAVNNNEIKIVLDIYTKSELSEKDKARIEIPNICRLHKPVTQKEVFRLQEESDILLFAETLNRKKDQGARLSFSTKITDYFRAGKCIWTVGSPTLGPVDYMIRKDASLLSTDIPSILQTLKHIISTPSLIEEYAHKAYNCGRTNHNGELILKTLYNAINQ